MKQFNNINKKFIILINLILFSQINLIKGKSHDISKNTFLPRSILSHSLNDLLLEKTLFTSKSNVKRKTALGLLSEYSQSFQANNNSSRNLGSMPFWSGTNTMTSNTRLEPRQTSTNRRLIAIAEK